MAIKYGGKTTPDYSAMRGPCPSGFHVPLNTEWQAVKDIWTALGGGSSDGTNFGIALKLPFAGYRYYSSAVASYQGTFARYWSSSRNNASNAHHLAFGSSNLTPQNGDYRTFGFSVRCFKDTPTVPTSSWTKLYGTSIESGGIFRSSTDGLISLSSDGNTWITIADKNLGATTVWNSGDTLSEANCGKYYQRGNNYGFPRTGTIANQSTTQVDASNYGPGNYYSSDTFIKYSGSWDSTDNGNLWGGVTGVQQKPVNMVERYYGGKLINDYSAMRGPCDEGFHIPNKNERENVIAAGATLGAYVRATGSGHVSDSEIPFRLQFKIPRISRREASGELVDASRFGHTHYWTYETSSGGIGYTLGIIDSYGSVRPNIYQSYSSNNEGRPIRPFKDVPVAPDNTRTRTYDGSSVAQGAGIFYNSSLKIISVSADGTTRYTIADRDIGATNTYTNASAGVQSDAIGSLFQRGNNYQFSPTGSVTTSATQVNANNYGPGNYYYGSTWITTTQRDSSGNKNLRGGVTGIQQKPTKVIEVYYGSTKIWPSYPAGVYWNPNIDGGVISISSNGTDWLTMADKNLGATTVYNYGDTMTEANCGKYYQWGNNYAFPFSGTPSISSTKVDISSYGPGNYYSNSTFRRVSGDGYWWTSASATAATNLWGEQTNTNEARRGPCPEGFHIPSHNEIIAWRNMTGLEYADRLRICKIPMMGTRDNYTGGVVDRGTDGGMRTTTLYDSDSAQGGYYSSYGVCRGLPIRPFRNEAIMPDDTRVAILN